jgi:hypothetical protein
MISSRASFYLFNSFFDYASYTASPKNSICCAEISCVLKLRITSPPQPFDLSAGT